MKKAFVLSPLLVALFAQSAVADDTLKFRGESGSSRSPPAWGRRPPPTS